MVRHSTGEEVCEGWRIPLLEKVILVRVVVR